MSPAQMAESPCVCGTKDAHLNDWGILPISSLQKLPRVPEQKLCTLNRKMPQTFATDIRDTSAENSLHGVLNKTSDNITAFC
jgi:hypothetical protein